MSQLYWQQLVFRAFNLAEKQMFSWTDSHGLFLKFLTDGMIETQGVPFRLNFRCYLSYYSFVFMKRLEKKMLRNVI